ncbi:MAG: hypothetical protein ACLPX7_02705 [Xanthobacteraceae bacterium]
MPSYQTVVLERHAAGYAVLTLNRPEKLNALDAGQRLVHECAWTAKANHRPRSLSAKRIRG